MKAPEKAALSQLISTRSLLDSYIKKRTRAPLLSHDSEAYHSFPGAPGIFWQPGSKERRRLRFDKMMDKRLQYTS